MNNSKVSSPQIKWIIQILLLMILNIWCSVAKSVIVIIINLLPILIILRKIKLM